MFGRLGFAELLILLIIILGFFAVIALVRGGRLRAVLMRGSEAAVFRRAEAPMPSEPAQRRRGLWFPRALAFVLPAAAVAVGLYGWLALVHPPFESREIRWTSAAGNESPIVYLVLYLSLLVLSLAGFRAAYLHFRPGHDRRRKYELLLMWASSMAFIWLLAYLDAAAPAQPLPYNFYISSYSYDVHPIAVSAILLILNPVTVMLMLDASTSRWRSHRPAGAPASRQLIRLHGLLRTLAVPVVFIFSPHPLLLVYLFLRYHVREILAEQPIVYLRSFHHASGPAAFGRIVVNAARKHGVLTALVHHSQPSSKLLRIANLFDQPFVERVPDACWHEWVTHRLQRAMAVIIDATLATEGLGWELQASLACVPRNRIAVLIEKGMTGCTADGVFRLDYALDAKSVKVARRQLSAWLGGLARP